MSSRRSSVLPPGPRRWGPTILVFIDAHPHAVVFGVALALRLLAVAWLSHVPYDTGGDAPHYLSLARDLVNGRPYGSTTGDTIRVPLYQALLAVHLRLFGEALTMIAVTQAFIGASTAVVMTLTARELMPGTRAWVAGLLWASYPPAIFNTPVIFTQTLQVLFLTLAFWLVFAGIRRRSTTRCVLAALCWGAACLTRSGNLFFLPVFAASPLLCWRLRGGSGFRWALRTGLVMLVLGASSVMWWTARDFPTTYRLEHLFLDQSERRAAALLLSPVEPVHGRLADRLRTWAGGPPVTSGTAGTRAGATAASPARPVDTANARRLFAAEIDRMSVKLWQTLRAPDGTVQLGCRWPPGGYWRQSQAADAWQVEAARLAISDSCLALKSIMYLEHYLLLAVSIPAFILLLRRLPGVGILLGLYLLYTLAIIVLGSNYSNELAAVPRFAFSLMPVPVLVTGLLMGPAQGRTHQHADQSRVHPAS